MLDASSLRPLLTPLVGGRNEQQHEAMANLIEENRILVGSSGAGSA